MGKIFKQLARHWAACLVVAALLIVQAYCDLSLPDYTSKIVDTGIQQGGIESPLPQTLRSSTLDALSLLMSEEDAAAFENAYEYYVQDDGVLKLRSDLTADERAALEEAVTVPDIVLYMTASQTADGTGMPAQSLTPLSEYPAASSGEEAASSAAPPTAESADETETVAPTADDLDAVCAQFAAMAQMPGFSREMIQQQLAGALAQMDETTLSSMASQATLLVSLEYEAQGVAHDVQMQYLFRVGGQMLGLTLLMVAVAILVGLIASRVSAAIGRDLRRETFSSVIHFSNAEIENFSTASLITRTTNDIQQVQFVCVILLRMVAYAPILGMGGIFHVVQGNTGLAWIIVLDVVLLLTLIAFLMNFAMPKFKIMQTLVDKLNLVSREILTGVMPVRAFSREKFEEERFDKASRELMGTQLFTNRHGRHDALYDPHHERHQSAHRLVRRQGHRCGQYAGGRDDRLHHLHNADRHVLPDAGHGGRDAAPRRCRCRPHRRSLPHHRLHPRPRRSHGQARAGAQGLEGCRQVRGREFPLPRRRQRRAGAHQLHRRAGPDHRHHRLHRLRQIHPAQPHPPLL